MSELQSGAESCLTNWVLNILMVVGSGFGGILVARYWQRKDGNSLLIKRDMEIVEGAIDEIAQDSINYFTVTAESGIKKSQSAIINYKFKKLRNNLRSLCASSGLNEELFFQASTELFNAVTRAPFNDSDFDCSVIDESRINAIEKAASDFLVAIRHVK